MAWSAHRQFGLGVALAATFCAGLGVAAASGDTIVLRDGRQFTGTIVSRDASKVVIQVEVSGGVMRQTVTADQLKEIRADVAPAGIAYLAVPVSGEIGTQVTADAIGKALDEARRLKVRNVVLLIDSPGGMVSEEIAICDKLLAAADLHPVALVLHAYSAASVIAMACPTVVMHPDGQIGGAVVVFAPEPGKTVPRPVEEKYASVVRAQARLVAARAGHDPLLVNAMSDIDSDIYVLHDGGRARLSDSPLPGTRSLKPKGKILTLTATEAAAAGLSAGTAATLAELGTLLGYPAAQWHSAGDQGRAIMHAAAETAKSRQADAQRALSDLNLAEGQRLAADEIRKRLASGEQGLQQLEQQRQAATARFEQDQQSVQYTPLAHSRDLYEKKQAELKERYDQTIAELDRNKAQIQKIVNQLREMQKDLDRP